MQAGSNADVIAQFLEAHGLSPAQTAGVLGNLEVESSFNPGASNPREGAIGIAQWENGRRSALDAFASATGGSETSLSTQLGYLWSELTGPYKSVLAEIKSTNNPATAAAYWDVGPGGVNSGTGFENSSGSATGQREANAESIYQRLISGQSLGGIAGGGGASATLASFLSKNGTGTGLAGGAPIDPNSLGSTLTPQQRNSIINWILSGPNGADVSGVNVSKLKALSDKQLIAAYKSFYQMVAAVGPSFNPLNSIVGEIETAVETIFDDIAHPIVTFLINAGLVIVGAVIIIIGLVLLAKSTDDNNGGGPPAAASGAGSHETGAGGSEGAGADAAEAVAA